ncbi:serine hydrolase domain-containing protein [Kitasatospora sp. NPDC002227]|uniref:serine hydrolase domain-containing protein n=1 Tax=Kitasatospora sp. NPDC002227 TaxID=3154773 RepID=UPI00331C9FE8
MSLAALVRAVPPGAAVVLVCDGEVHCHGRTAFSGGEPVTPATGFETGSVSKTFTALLLAEAVHRGEIALDEPVPVGGALVTPLRLATHTAGLPRLPPGLLRSGLASWGSNPYAAYSAADLTQALDRTRVRRHPGVHYSNYGVGLLGRLLADRAGLDYPALLATRICTPLGLTGTTCTPGTAVGHHRGRPLPPWEIPALPGAGAVRSTGQDLQRYLAAHLAPGGPLAPALRDVQLPRLRRGRTGPALGLAWHLRDGCWFHSGATRGFTALVAFNPGTGRAVAALTNTGPARRFLDTAYGLLYRTEPNA